ncbi:hypothetical protein Slala03_13590 [Streptomyces lavendulae subsp. lavendulae]|nr:hypothetical protein Slala03_13590 [Streptomyces lavendulae subsp. lavendulae]GLV96899.1 hypothetical protein Slala05_05310 [Streptomyces lavendulae subsp. lavendulae]GLX37147.1 hypothetical protein Sros01_32200 [Streptomyces roseochromogenus]
MPGHPVHPVQPVQPAPPTQSRPSPHSAGGSHGPSVLHPSVRSAGRAHDDPAGDVVRWAAFSCLLVPVVLVVYGTSYGGAAVATLGLAAVTAACRVLLRHSEKTERAAARVRSEDPLPLGHRGRHSRSGAGSHRGCHGSGALSPHD